MYDKRTNGHKIETTVSSFKIKIIKSLCPAHCTGLMITKNNILNPKCSNFTDSLQETATTQPEYTIHCIVVAYNQCCNDRLMTHQTMLYHLTEQCTVLNCIAINFLVSNQSAAGDFPHPLPLPL